MKTFVILCISDKEWHREMALLQFLCLLTEISGLFLLTHCQSLHFVSASYILHQTYELTDNFSSHRLWSQ